jgi:hypothetical protein
MEKTVGFPCAVVPAKHCQNFALPPKAARRFGMSIVLSRYLSATSLALAAFAWKARDRESNDDKDLGFVELPDDFQGELSARALKQ